MRIRNLSLLTAVVATAIPVAAQADWISIRRNAVVPVRFEQDLRIRDARRGQTFNVRVEANRDLPPGTRLEGRIRDIRRENRDRRDYVDLEFTHVVLPRGERREIDAVPIPLDDRAVRRDRDGRWEARRPDGNIAYVLGGALGGLVLGSTIDKRVEGTILGALAGIAIGESNRGQADLVIRRGTRVGARFTRDFRFETDRYGYNWGDDRWDDGRWDDDRWDDDRWDRDRDGWPRDRGNPDRPGGWSPVPPRGDWGFDRDDRDNRYGDGYTISVGSRIVRFSEREQPFRSGGTTMVPLEAMARQIGFRVQRRGTEWELDGDRESIRFATGSRNYRSEFGSGTFPRAAESVNGTVYVPIEAFQRVSREPVRLGANRF